MSKLNLEIVLNSLPNVSKLTGDAISAKQVLSEHTDTEFFIGMSGDKKIHILLAPVTEADVDNILALQSKNISCCITELTIENQKKRC